MEFNLLIDGNYLLSQHTFALAKSNMLYGKLLPTLFDSINKLKKLHSFNRVYVVSDSRGSWRKQVYADYKGKRKRDSSINWDFVFQTFDQFKAKCSEELHVKVLEHPSVEGDDWISKVVKRQNNEGFSNLIVSSDKDLLQLVKCSTVQPNYMNVMMNNDYYNGRLYLPKGYELLVQEHATPVNSLFGISEEDIDQLIINLQVNKKTEVVDHEEALFCKVIGGDKKTDNIPSVYVKNDRGIGEAGAMTIYELYKKQYPEPINFCTKEFVERASLTVTENKKDTAKEVIETVQKCVARNLKLIVLEERFMPKDLAENMNKYL